MKKTRLPYRRTLTVCLFGLSLVIIVILLASILFKILSKNSSFGFVSFLRIQ